jgi:hypothetical protein
MPIAASLTVAPDAPNSGDTVTATYAITGNDPVASTSATVSGVATVGGVDYVASTTITLPGVPALPESFAVPTCLGLTFAATADPAVFTALVP